MTGPKLYFCISVYVCMTLLHGKSSIVEWVGRWWLLTPGSVYASPVRAECTSMRRHQSLHCSQAYGICTSGLHLYTWLCTATSCMAAITFLRSRIGHWKGTILVATKLTPYILVLHRILILSVVDIAQLHSCTAASTHPLIPQHFSERINIRSKLWCIVHNNWLTDKCQNL